MAVDHPYPGRPLKRGSRGKAVRELQVQLNVLGGKQIKADGVFEGKTDNKLREFQKRRHLGSQGDVDAVIWDRLFGNPPPKLHPRSPETDQDRLRRLREEVPFRQRQLKALKPGRRRTRVLKRYRQVTAAIVAIVRPPRPHVEGNLVLGKGTPREKLVIAALAAAHLSATGERHSFYSQEGEWTVSCAITGEPDGFRSDCSQWVTSAFHSAGLPDPNGEGFEGGFTGTLGEHCREINRGLARAGDLVLYGSPPFHHVELYIGLGLGLPRYLRRRLRKLGFSGSTTVGHGSPPVDTSTVDRIADAHFYTAF